jgi:hypothetical protein
MKLIIGDKKYDVHESIQHVALGDVLQLKKQSAADGEPPVTVKTIQATFTRMREVTKTEGFNPVDLLEDDDFLRSMIGLIFVARRRAGEDITFEDAANTPFDSFHLDTDGDEEEESEEADPKVPPAFARDAGAKRPPSTT